MIEYNVFCNHHLLDLDCILVVLSASSDCIVSIVKTDSFAMSNRICFMSSSTRLTSIFFLYLVTKIKWTFSKNLAWEELLYFFFLDIRKLSVAALYYSKFWYRQQWKLSQITHISSDFTQQRNRKRN